MIFLTFKENSQLQQFLINNKLLQTPDAEFRSALLHNCGLEKVCTEIQLDKPSFQFVSILYKKLSEVTVIVENSERLALIVFLEHLVLIDENCKYDEKIFINEVISKWEKQNQKPSIQQQKVNEIENLLSQGRQKYTAFSKKETSMKIDRSIIINFDLKRLILKFREKITYEGAFAFSLGGDVLLLEQYIIERIRNELKDFTKRENQQFEIQLYKDSIIKYEDIERRFLNKYEYESLTEVFETQANTDVIFIVWNYDIPLKSMKTLAEISWSTMNDNISSIIKNRSRCFVLIWVNVNRNPLGGFTILPTEKFEADDLDAWFRFQLQTSGVAEERINYYLYRLKNQYGNLVGTYREMNHMIQELQGGY